MDLAAKGWLAACATGFENAVKSPLLWSALVVNIIFLVVMRMGTIYGCKHTDVLSFVPLNTVLNIFISSSTGMISLAESSVVVSWAGLISTSVSIIAGVIMLVSGPADCIPEEGQPSLTEDKLDRRRSADGGLGILGPQGSNLARAISCRSQPSVAAAVSVGSRSEVSSGDVLSEFDDDQLETDPTDSDPGSSESSPTMVSGVPCLFIFWTKSMALFRMNRIHMDRADRAGSMVDLNGSGRSLGR